MPLGQQTGLAVTRRRVKQRQAAREDLVQPAQQGSRGPPAGSAEPGRDLGENGIAEAVHGVRMFRRATSIANRPALPTGSRRASYPSHSRLGDAGRAS